MRDQKETSKRKKGREPRSKRKLAREPRTKRKLVEGRKESESRIKRKLI